MAADGEPVGVVLGERLGPFSGRIPGELARRYAAATADHDERVTAGAAVPAAALVTQIWEAQREAFAVLVPEGVRSTMTGGVHGEHDMVLHRPITPGEQLHTWVEGHGSKRGGPHNLVTMRYATCDSSGALIAEQWWTTVLLHAAGRPVGASPPAKPALPGDELAPVGSFRVPTDPALVRRYAEVSGDWSAHHFDAEAARASGYDRLFLHGLCSMGICAQGIVGIVAPGRPDRVSRLAVRFASPTFIGEDIEVTVASGDAGTFVFEATSAGEAVIRHGVLELRPRS